MADKAKSPDLTRRRPTEAEKVNALDAAAALEKTQKQAGRIEFDTGDGASVRLSPALSDIVLGLLTQVGRGHAVPLGPPDSLLTTQQAADMLNVSRPYVSKLLKDGEIPFIPVGAHRRVMKADVVAYLKRRGAARQAKLDELARLGQEMDAS